MPESQAIENANPAVEASLTYTLHRSEKLIYLITDMGEDEDDPEYHKWHDVHQMPIRDGRTNVGNLSLDREGFVLLQAETGIQNFYDDDEVEAVYNPEVENLIKEQTGADRVLVFDHTIRIASDDLRRERQVREIVDLVHNDYTENSGPQRVSDLLGDGEAEKHLETRFAIYNLWRTIAGTVKSAPLAMCDATSVDKEDWVACGLDYGDRMGEIYNVSFNAEHQWQYFPDMTSDEVLIFKNYDSAEDGRTRFTPHTAFIDPTSAPDAPPRESIETRVLAFFTGEAE